jgi:hypothetical protein
VTDPVFILALVPCLDVPLRTFWWRRTEKLLQPDVRPSLAICRR